MKLIECIKKWLLNAKTTHFFYFFPWYFSCGPRKCVIFKDTLRKFIYDGTFQYSFHVIKRKKENCIFQWSLLEVVFKWDLMFFYLIRVYMCTCILWKVTYIWDMIQKPFLLWYTLDSYTFSLPCLRFFFFQYLIALLGDLWTK